MAKALKQPEAELRQRALKPKTPGVWPHRNTPCANAKSRL